MKVNDPRPFARFGDVNPGRCFRYFGRVWLKTRPSAASVYIMTYDAVSVENGDVGGFFAETLVEPVDVDARVS